MADKARQVNGWIGVLKKSLGVPADYASERADAAIAERHGAGMRPKGFSAREEQKNVPAPMDAQELKRHQMNAQEQFDRNMEAIDAPNRKAREAALKAQEEKDRQIAAQGYKKY